MTIKEFKEAIKDLSEETKLYVVWGICNLKLVDGVLTEYNEILKENILIIE